MLLALENDLLKSSMFSFNPLPCPNYVVPCPNHLVLNSRKYMHRNGTRLKLHVANPLASKLYPPTCSLKKKCLKKYVQFIKKWRKKCGYKVQFWGLQEKFLDLLLDGGDLWLDLRTLVLSHAKT